MSQKKSIKKVLFFLFFSLIILALFLNHSFSYLDPDLGWHLKAGQDIWQAQEVSRANLYNYTLENIDWINHEWLLDTFSFLIFDKLGYIALSIFFALIATLIIILLFFLIRILNDKKNYLTSFYTIFSILGYFLLAPSFGVRLQEIGVLNLILLLIIIAKYNQKKKTKYLFWLLPLFLFWANTHGSFLFGLAVLLLYLGLEIIKKMSLIKKLSWLELGLKTSNKKVFTFSIFIVLSASITLINPYGVELYSFLKGYSNTFYLKYIAEWLPIHYEPINYYVIAYISIFIALFVFNFEKIKKEKSLNIFWWALAFITILMALKSKRNSTLLLISSFPAMIYLAQTSFSKKELDILKNKINYFIDNKIFKIFFIIMYIIALFKIIISINFISQPFSAYCHKYPCQALKHIQTNSDLKNLKLFNSYGWGGYLIWNWPEKKIFIDGRMPQIEYENHTVIEEYVNFFDEDKLEAQLKKHQIELILIEKPEEEKKLKWYQKIDKNIEKKSKSHLIEFLNNSQDWQQIFINNTSIVYVKKTAL